MELKPNYNGTCPHCKIGVRFEIADIHGMPGRHEQFVVQTPGGVRLLLHLPACPNCCLPSVFLKSMIAPNGTVKELGQLVWPEPSDRPVPAEVAAEAPQLAEDFREAAAVYPRSRKASAALARRCLQFVLTSKGGATRRDLAEQIEEVLPRLPQELALNVDAIRQVGNFAAHPLKSKSTGEIVAVEDGEAEWLLDVLEELFEHYYVAPAAAVARREALNRKLEDLGKPPLKTP